MKTAMTTSGFAAVLAALAIAGCGDTIDVPWPKDAVVTGVSPSTGPYTGGTAVTVHGFGFEPGVEVAFAGVPAISAERISQYEISCVTPGGTPGPVEVGAKNPEGEWGSLADAFTYTGWFDLAWSFRREIAVSGSTAGDQTDYQIQVSVDYCPNIKPDFGDVRFAQKTGYSEVALPSWAETVSASSNAVFWVRVASIPAAGATLYMYYGNPAAVSASDFDATFTKDFGETGLLDLWHIDEGGGLFASDSAGLLGMSLENFASPFGWTASDGGAWGTRRDAGFSTGSAVLLDGVDDRLDSAGTISSGSALTVEAWVKGTGAGSCNTEQVIASQWNSDGTRFSAPGSWTAFDPGYGTNGTDGLDDAILGLDIDGLWGGAFDGRYVYFGMHNNGAGYNGTVLRFDTRGGYASISSWTAFDPKANGVGSDPRGFSGCAFDGRYVYFSPYYNSTQHGEVLRYDTQSTAGFADAASWSTFDPGNPAPLWSTLASMSSARSYFRAAAAGGKIYVVGGIGSPDLAVCEAFDPATGTWNATPLASMSIGRNSPGLASYGGKVYAFGGLYSSVVQNSVEEYDPVGDAWVGKLAMATARWGMVCVEHNGKIYCMGGATDSGATTYTNEVRAYDPANNTWSGALAVMPVARFMAAGVSAGGKIYIVSGQGPPGTYTGVLDIYDPGSNTWSTGSTMPAGRHGLVAEAAGGKIYAMGGWNGSSYQSRVDVYDPLTDVWSQGVPLSSTREHFAGESLNGRIYVFGGGNPTATAVTEVYDAASESPLGDADGFYGTVFDGRHLYLVPMNNGYGGHSNVVRYDTLKPFDSVSSWESFDAYAQGVVAKRAYNGAMFDGTYIYFSPSGSSGEVLRFDTRKPFAAKESWEAYEPGLDGIGTISAGFAGGVFDGRYVYFSPYYNGSVYHREVLRYDTSGGFRDPASWAARTPAAGILGHWGAVFDGKYVYFVPRYTNNAGTFLRFDTAGDFNDNGAWSVFDPGSAGVGVDLDGFLGAISDGRNIYFPQYNNGAAYAGEILRFDTTGSDSSFKLLWSTANRSGSYSGEPFGAGAVLNTSAGVFSAHANSVLPAGEWHHVAMTYDGSALSLYVDGSQAASCTATGTVNSCSSPLQIGGFYGSRATFAGLVDDVRIHDRALPAAEILAHSQRRKYASPEPQVTIIGDEVHK